MLKEDKYSIEYSSPNFERVVGISIENAPMDLTVLNCSDRELDELNENEALDCIELERMDPKSGMCKWLRETIYCTYIGNEKKYIVYISDRTKEREVENSLKMALEAAQIANQAKSTFLSSVSHDIRTPMNAIIGLLTLLQQEANDPKAVLEYAKRMEGTCWGLLMMCWI